ncbi:MAG: response regulator [Thermodesulfobacteria bacterium]|nr:response regulator [Thermodesulfobacteriota bacterium]
MISGSVLVIDDEQEMRDTLKLLLDHSGFNTTVCASVEDGLSKLAEEFFDVVVTDYYLEDGTGSDIMKYCREYCPKTRVIVMTGHASLENAVDALRNGAFDYVTKPFEFDLLYHALQRALEHIAMMDEIALAKERYRALIEDMNEGYLIVKNDVIHYANPKMAAILRCPQKELINRPILDFVDFGFQEQLKSKMDLLYRFPGAFFMEEVVFRDCKGNTVPVELRLANTLGEHIEQGIIFICREITERDVLWNRLIRAERLATMGEMMATVAHELNNKLTPILGYAEILSADMNKEQLERAIESIRTASQGAKKIVNSLLLFSRREKPTKIECNINDIIENACSLVSTCVSQGTVIKIEKHLDPALPGIMADPHQIEQVITNVMKNAIDALAPDGGTVRIETSAQGGHVLIKITDDGPGIPEEIIKNIFDPFFSTKNKKEGTGLGLSICHGIIKEHGGDINVFSKPGYTSFTIKLPTNTSGTCGEMVSDENNIIHFNLKKKPWILVVDDEYEISELLIEVFSQRFHAVRASNGLEAIEKLKRQKMDVIITDLKMPEMDGIELYERLLKEFPEYRNKVIFTTGIVSDLETINFLKKYKLPYLRKPFKMKELFSIVNAVLEKDKKLHNINHFS